MTSFSKAHWSDGDHIMVAPLGTCGGGQPCSRGNGMDMDQQSGLAWFNLESAAPGDINNLATSLKGTAWDWIYPPATGLYATAPSFSHDGMKVLFTMTDKVKSGRLGTSGNTHLYTVPYSKTAPQAAMPVPGDGSAAGRVQYYGALSGDDKFIAYNELDATTANNQHAALDQMDLNANVTLDGMYAQPKTELFVLQSTGGTKKPRIPTVSPPATGCSHAVEAGRRRKPRRSHSRSFTNATELSPPTTPSTAYTPSSVGLTRWYPAT